jgi:hypothetical protein
MPLKESPHGGTLESTLTLQRLHPIKLETSTTRWISLDRLR